MVVVEFVLHTCNCACSQKSLTAAIKYKYILTLFLVYYSWNDWFYAHIFFYICCICLVILNLMTTSWKRGVKPMTPAPIKLDQRASTVHIIVVNYASTRNIYVIVHWRDYICGNLLSEEWRFTVETTF